MFSGFFIDRPIFAAVLSIIVTLAGGIALFALPIAQYPEITPPTVEVSAIYPGANAQVVADSVAAPIEQQVNGVENMLYMSSQCTNDGAYTLTVTFRLGTDLNIAQVLVQNRVSLANPVLPSLVQRRGVLVKKKSPSVLMIINLFSPDKSRESLDLSNYATIQLRDELARLPGVGDITYLGQRDYSMRVWLNPQKLSAMNITAADVTTAITQQNAQVAAGQIGQPPVEHGQVFQYTMTTLGRLVDEEQFGAIVVKTDGQGRVVRLRDVAKIELGAQVYDQSCTFDGKPSVALSLYQLPGSNALDTARQVREKMEDLKARFPQGIDYKIVYDTTPFITESIDEVFKTLRDAIILVALVVLVFLQNWRSAIIPLVAVPVAIIGTFAVMAGLHFSLNNLTLFGLVLAIGIVVDDAIVVVEAVEHHIEHGMAPRDATIKAMQQVSGPVVAVGLVLTAVFVPCAFITGITGQFFRQFALTIAVSTVISTFNSLTLSPALAALLLRPREKGKYQALPVLAFVALGGWLAWEFSPLVFHWLENATGRSLTEGPLPNFLLKPLTWIELRSGHTFSENAHQMLIIWRCAAVALGALLGLLASWPLNRLLGFLFYLFNLAFDFSTNVYTRIVAVSLRVSLIVLLLYGGLLLLTYREFTTTPTGFIPNQDKGYLLVNVQLPDSSSVKRTQAVMEKLEQMALKTPGVRNTVGIAGQSILLNANAPNFGALYVMLDDFHDRRAPELSGEAIGETLRQQAQREIEDAVVNVFGAPPVEGLGTAGGFKIVIQDRGNGDSKELQAKAEEIVAAGEQSGKLQGMFTSFRANTPWLFMDIDRTRAELMGVSIGDLFNTIQVYLASLYVNDFNKFGRTWQVNLQAASTFREKVEDFKQFKTRNSSGGEVPLSTLMTTREVEGPVMIVRYNMYPSATINGNPGPGVSSGQALTSVEEIAKSKLDRSMRPEWTELALLQLQTGNTAMIVFLLAVVLVFLVLAAQYESWSLPLAVILVVPMCLLCSVAGVVFAKMDINIFTQIGFVVLVGLACKNAILIVEFAKSETENGVSPYQATLDACKLRLRPIMMTSFAFILGVVPLVLSEGAGAEMRRTLGTAVFGGMLGVTLFGIFLTPVFFYVIQRFKQWRERGRPSDEENRELIVLPDHGAH